MYELTERQRQLLSIIIQEYIDTAAPVGSQAVVRRAALNVSTATVRNEMMEIEDAGYIYQPHTSAGRVPSDRGYRYFVETLLQESELTSDEQRTIQHQFHQVELELDQWAHLAASILAQTVGNASVVSTPAAARCRLKHIEIVSVQDDIALLIVVLNEGHVRQKMIAVDPTMTRESLSLIASKLTTIFGERSASQIAAQREPSLITFEEAVRDDVVRMMQLVDQMSYTDLIFDGLVLMLRQPEFFGSDKINQILETLQQKEVVTALATEIVHSAGVRVVIGNEITSPSMQECTVILAPYGAVERIAGIMGVLGPKRMRYEKAIPAVRYVSRLMTSLLNELYS